VLEYSFDEGVCTLKELLFKKSVDQSLLIAGTTIPAGVQKRFTQSLGVHIDRGQKATIKIIIEGNSYEATLTYVDLSEKYANRNVLQIRYSEKSPISQALNQIFSHSVHVIDQLQKANRDVKKRFVIPEDDQEFVEVYAIGPSTIQFNCFPKQNQQNQTLQVDVGPMRTFISRILDEYSGAKSESFAGHPMGAYFRNHIPDIIYKTGIVKQQTHLITGSVGQGNWATVPWICIFDRSITTTATKGVYIVYLLSQDGKSLYLTFNQGCTDIRRAHTKRDTIEIMRQKASEIRASIDSRGFRKDEAISLGSGLTELAELYQKGAIFYKEYRKDLIPSESELRTDLSNMMQIYSDYIAHIHGNDIVHQETGGEIELVVKDAISDIRNFITSKGFRFDDSLIDNFYLSLKTKPFVILAGISGTGKTRLVRLFAESIGATPSNGRFKMVPVRPDWSDSSDLFGHVDLNGRFIPGMILDFVKQAEADITNPYFLCLDEMNLARVEYYLSDVLSVIETREFNGDTIVTDPLVESKYYGSDTEATVKYGDVLFPENLYIVGTVNMDETTFPFSKKVLDRANTIEFSHVDLTPLFDEDIASHPAQNLNNSFLKSEYLLLAQCTHDYEAVTTYCTELESINRILQTANAHIGYRVRDEIVFYLLNNKRTGLLDVKDAMDNEVIQKILPRIQGSSASVKNMLCELFKHCAGDYEGYQTENDDISSKMMKAAQRPECQYKKSAEKIAFMVRRFEEDGFTSYWL